jgi:hypothetical protein
MTPSFWLFSRIFSSTSLTFASNLFHARAANWTLGSHTIGTYCLYGYKKIYRDLKRNISFPIEYLPISFGRRDKAKTKGRNKMKKEFKSREMRY